MNDKKALLRKVRTAIAVLLCVVIVSVIGIGYGKQTYAKKAFAAKETEVKNETDAKKSMVDAEDEMAPFQLKQLYRPFGKQPFGALLTAATHKVISFAREDVSGQTGICSLRSALCRDAT